MKVYLEHLCLILWSKTHMIQTDVCPAKLLI